MAELNLDQLLERARQGHPVLRQAHAEVARAQAVRRRASLPTPSAKETTVEERQARFGATTHALGQAAFGVAYEWFALQAEVGLAYWDCVAARKAEELFDHVLIPRAKDLDKLVLRHRQVGMRDRLDLIRSEASVENHDLAAQGARLARKRFERRLASLAVLPDLGGDTVQGDFTPDPRTAISTPDELWKHVIETNPELRLAQLSVSRDRLEGRANRARELGPAKAGANVEPASLPVLAARSAAAAAQAEAMADAFEVRRVEASLRERLSTALERRDRALAFRKKFDALHRPAQEHFESLLHRYGQRDGASPPPFDSLLGAQLDLARIHLAALDAGRDLWQAHSLFEAALVGGALAPPLGGVRSDFATPADPTPPASFHAADLL